MGELWQRQFARWRRRVFTRGVGLLWLIHILTPTASQASDSSVISRRLDQTVKVKVLTVDPDGLINELPWIAKPFFTLDSASKFSPVGDAYMQIQIEPRGALKLETLDQSDSLTTGPPAQSTGPPVQRSDFPKAIISENKSQITFLTKEAISSIPVLLKYPDGSDRRVNLLIQILAQKTHEYVDPNCAGQNVKWETLNQASTHLYTALFCPEVSSGIEAYLLYSDYATVTQKSSYAKVKHSTGISHFEFPPFAQSEIPIVETIPVQIGNAYDDRKTNHVLSVIPKPPNKKVFFTLGAGPTFMNYFEKLDKPVPIEKQSLAFTVKGTASYPLIRNKIDISGNAFVNAFTLTHSPDTIVAPRFWGVNGRLGWRYPSPVLSLNWSLSAGWYLWGMQVPKKAYGLTKIFGPQLFLFGMKSEMGKRFFYFYLKHAPLGQSFTTFLRDREMAFGAGVQINSLKAKNRINLTLDVSDLNIGPVVETGNNEEIKLQSYSLGIGIGF